MKPLKLKAKTGMFYTGGVCLVSSQFDFTFGWLDGHPHALFGECPRCHYPWVSFLDPFRFPKQEFFSFVAGCVVVGAPRALSAVFSKLWYKVRVWGLHSEEWALPPHCGDVSVSGLGPGGSVFPAGTWGGGGHAWVTRLHDMCSASPWFPACFSTQLLWDGEV